VGGLLSRQKEAAMRPMIRRGTVACAKTWRSSTRSTGSTCNRARRFRSTARSTHVR